VGDVQLPVTSTLDIPIEKDMSAPVYVYTVLTDFFQNHKRYVRSVSAKQLHKGKATKKKSDQCKPEFRLTVPGESLVDYGKIFPCGLRAWSTFNDTLDSFRVRSSCVAHCAASVSSCRVCTVAHTRCCRKQGASAHLHICTATATRSGAPTACWRAGRKDAHALQVSRGGAPDAPLAFDGSDLVWNTDRNELYAHSKPRNFNIVPAKRGGKVVTGPIDEDEHFMAWMRPYVKPGARTCRLWPLKCCTRAAGAALTARVACWAVAVQEVCARCHTAARAPDLGFGAARCPIPCCTPALSLSIDNSGALVLQTCASSGARSTAT
jgi:LEM3 (ligand-effect modulator 3) family / CDC50 family